MSDSNLPPHANICLIICDPTKEEFIDSYGNITNLFTNLYTKLLLRLTREPSSLLPMVLKSFRIHPYNVVQDNFPDIKTIDQFDSILVSGSANGVNDPDQWIEKLGKLLHTVATDHPKVKLMGVCFGHQIISKAVLGLPVGENPKGWEIGPYEVNLNETGKQLFENHEHLNVSMFHHDAVFTRSQLAFFDELVETTPYSSNVPQNEYKIWASTPATANQGVISMNKQAAKSGRLNVDDIHIFTTQGHPELNQGMTSYLVDLFEHELGADVAAEARKRIADFKGILDWFQLSIVMWALTTKHSLSLPQLSEKINGYESAVKGVEKSGGFKAEAALMEEEKVFVLIT
ncbi:class I glutamine amidotransferase-like protein [Coniophora puteana RWD-64-598 SS2]|uniref:Class I glutamine amidotransferase-like protein n=1 Tax=Coniophora puteana (strain RWD-64-598) TaxID=741705 RepID=A0A5M3M881_CONPW|nr:class I glutamine amidotransferase-like protein [Coniophora puteana RWD-64-598 SS2]EIW74995.1 class I glutamine amidotransferase-like protein [Coniophora puteana RWD-64-598 SS2]